MTTLQSQYQSASSSTQNTVIPDSDSFWVQLVSRYLGFKSSLIPEASTFPPVTDGLAARILKVRESIAHAREHKSLPYARLLIDWDDAFDDQVTRLSSQKKPPCNDRDALVAYRTQETVLKTKPQTLDDCKKQLAAQFEVCAGFSGPRWFAERNRLADLYDYTAVKAGFNPHP